MFRELTPPEVYEELAENDSAVLVDCRAPAEWHFTGIADLSGIGKKPVLVAIGSIRPPIITSKTAFSI